MLNARIAFASSLDVGSPKFFSIVHLFIVGSYSI
jgi:hypothetical protein